MAAWNSRRVCRESMITCSKFGWSKIEIGGWKDRISYLDDVPFELLKALIESCKTHTPKCVKFDAEGYEYILVFEWLSVYVIYQDIWLPKQVKEEESSEMKAFRLNVGRDEICESLIRDIRENVEDWASFYCMCDEYTSEKMAKRKEKLLSLCDDLEKLLPSDDFRVIYPASKKKGEPKSEDAKE